MDGRVALQVAMTVQVLLGVARFGAGLAGFAIPPAVRARASRSWES